MTRPPKQDPSPPVAAAMALEEELDRIRAWPESASRSIRSASSRAAERP